LNKRGRPPIDNPKKYTVALRMDADMKMILLRHKANTGESMSEYITRLVREDVGKGNK